VHPDYQIIEKVKMIEGRFINEFDIKKNQKVTEFKRFMDLFAAIRMFIWVIGVGTIIAGIVGVSNIMIIAVKERTKEIGIRKSMGATPFYRIMLIMQESVFLTSFAGYFGLVAGVGLVEGINFALIKFNVDNEMFRSSEVDFQVAVTALVILVVSGANACFIPARRAVKVRPIDALRDE
jgi:putative ABC transport system permease protein